MARSLPPARRLGLAPGVVGIVDYDPRWPLEFRRIRSRLSTLVPGARVEHIGSTAVPGCAAKPIIDVSVGLPAGVRLGAEEARAIGLEFRSVRSYAAIFAQTDPSGRRVAHIHVRPLDSESERHDLRFRDFLRTHPDAVRDYVATKRRILSDPAGRAGYTRAKAPFIDGLSDRIRRWADEVGWAPGRSRGSAERRARRG